MQRTIIGKLNSEALPILTLSLTLLIATAMMKYLIAPGWKDLQNAKERLGKYETLISSESGFAQIKNDIEQKNLQLHKKLETLSGNAGDSRDIASYLKLLIDKARTADIRFVKMQPQTDEKNEDFIFSPVLLEMSTTYYALGRFVSALEKLPHNFKVNRLSIDAQSNGKINVKLLVISIIPIQED